MASWARNECDVLRIGYWNGHDDALRALAGVNPLVSTGAEDETFRMVVPTGGVGPGEKHA